MLPSRILLICSLSASIVIHAGNTGGANNNCSIAVDAIGPARLCSRDATLPCLANPSLLQSSHYGNLVKGTVIAVAAFAWGLFGLWFTNEILAYLRLDDPQLAPFHAVQDAFVKQDALQLLVRSHPGSFLTLQQV